MALAPGAFTALATLTWLCLIGRQVTDPATGVWLLAGGAVGLTAGVHLLRVRALPGWGQVYLTLAHGLWLAAFAYASPFHPYLPPPVWNPLLLLAATLALGHWWQWRRAAEGPLHQAGGAVAGWNAVLAVAFLSLWLSPPVRGGAALWAAEFALLSLTALAYGLLTRYPALAAGGQGLLALSVLSALVSGSAGSGARVEPSLALVPLLVVLLTLAAARRFRWADGKPPWVGNLRAGYELAAVALFLTWVGRYAPQRDWFTLDCLAGGMVFALGVRLRERRDLIWSGVLTAAGVLVFGLVYGSEERRHWLNLIGVLIIAAEQQFGQRALSREEQAALFPPKAQGALMVAATLCAWTMAGSWATGQWPGGGFALAVSWSLFAAGVFGLGLGLHEKVYRWLGLGVLGVTLLHIAAFDLWQLDALGRAVSALCLGLVVLGIGFLYNRFHAKFRRLF